MKFTLISLMILCFVFIIGCSNTLSKDEISTKDSISINDMTAALVEQSDDNLQLITQAVSDALNGTNVTLAPDTFTTSNSLTTERMMQDKLGQEGMNGRLMQTPDNISHRFKLLKTGNDCYLYYENKEKLVPIKGLVCK